MFDIENDHNQYLLTPTQTFYPNPNPNPNPTIVP
jgi:hypothetical protein